MAGARVQDEGEQREEQLREVLLPDDEEGIEQNGNELTFLEELKSLSLLSLPVAIATLARLVIINTDTAFVGHLGKEMLTASSFANTWNQFLSNVIFAPGYALNSLCSQAIGAGNLKLAGVWLQLAIFCTMVLCVPVLGGYLLTEVVVNLMVSDEEADVPHLAQEFNTVSMLILLPMVMYMIIRQFFQAMQVVKPAMVVSVLTVGVNYAFNYLFVPADGPVGWGLKGSPFATFLSMLFQLGSFLAYCVLYKGYHKAYWGGWSLDFLQKSRISRFFKMVLPMAIGIVLENSGLQLISFSTGHIGSKNIAAHAILGSLWGVLWSLYWGVGLALQVKVGGYLGDGNVHGARLVAKISMFLVFLICSAVGILTYAGRSWIADLFCSDEDEDVKQVVRESMYALVLDYFFACMALCAVNLLEAMAQNRILAFTLSFGMWAVQVPCSLLFAYKVPMYKDRPVEGIWMGQVLGELFKMIVLWGYIARLDWDKMCREAKERSEMADHEFEQEDENLEHLLEEEDPDFAAEAAHAPSASVPVAMAVSSASPRATAEGLASSLQAGSRSPFVGSRSPRFVRNID